MTESNSTIVACDGRYRSKTHGYGGITCSNTCGMPRAESASLTSSYFQDSRRANASATEIRFPWWEVPLSDCLIRRCSVTDPALAQAREQKFFALAVARTTNAFAHQGQTLASFCAVFPIQPMRPLQDDVQKLSRFSFCDRVHSFFGRSNGFPQAHTSDTIFMEEIMPTRQVSV